jgi:hypothetical protein
MDKMDVDKMEVEEVEEMEKMEVEKMDEVDETDKLVNAYIQTLTEMERITLEIARNHLGSSFDITKTIAWISFSKK